MVVVMSFGLKHGPAPEGFRLFDCRGLPNPHIEHSLRKMTGRQPAVQEYVMSSASAHRMLDEAERAAASSDVAFFCVGGRHRSVTLAEKLAERLRKKGIAVKLRHRDL